MPNPALLSRPSYQDTYLGMSGLVLYVPLTGPSDTRDRVGGGVGTVAGTVSSGGPIPLNDSGGSARFTGVASTAITGTNANLPTGAAVAASWSVWVYATVLPTTMCLAGFGSTASSPTNGSLRAILANSGKIQLWGVNAAGDIITATNFDVGAPDLIVCTKTNGTTAEVWKNGVSIGSSSGLSFAASTTTWWVAHSHPVSVIAETDKLSISHFAVWNRVLSSAEIKNLYQQGMS